MTASAVEPLALRAAMGRFATGVAVVTARGADGAPHGMTINSLTSVSLTPPLVLVSLTEGSRTGGAITESGRFAFSILAAHQDGVAARFAARGTDHFDGLPIAADGIPTVPNALAEVHCSVEQMVPAGDHVLFLGRVESVTEREGRPLLFFSGRFGDHSPRHEALPEWFF